MAAAAATEAQPPGGTKFAFAGGSEAADDFRQAPEQSGEQFKAAAAASSEPTTGASSAPTASASSLPTANVTRTAVAAPSTFESAAAAAAPSTDAAAAAPGCTPAAAGAAGVSGAGDVPLVFMSSATASFAPAAAAGSSGAAAGAASSSASAAVLSDPPGAAGSSNASATGAPPGAAAAAGPPAAAAANADAGDAAAAAKSRDAAAAVAPGSPSGGIPVSELPLCPGETALLEYRKLGRKYTSKGLTDYFMPTMAEEDLDQFGWQEALRITVDPLPWTLPTEALTHKPTPDEIHKFFFKDTPHEVCIRQIFFHVPLSEVEQQWLQDFREKCSSCNWTIPFFLEPHVLRLVWFCKRKYPEDALNKSLEQAQLMVEWRRQMYPICDTEKELRKLLDMGVMYWVGRDASLRPLLVVRLSRLPKTTPPELFKRLTIFCFEWSLRFLMIPGVVETCVVLFDVRTVPLHQFPISALTDMVTTLTKQFPFRLHRMWIINDSFFVQTAWNIVKQFLTDVQQQKIRFYRTGFETELLKEYATHQLETHYGGTRELTAFYPFPVAPGPFTPSAPPPPVTTPSIPAYKASDRYTAFGVVWEGTCRVPLQWADGEAAKVFRSVGLAPPLPPITLRDEKVAKALEVVEKATLAQRTSGIKSYKSMAQRLGSAVGIFDAGSSPRAGDSPSTGRTETLGLVGTEMSKRLSTVQYTAFPINTNSPLADATSSAAQGDAESPVVAETARAADSGAASDPALGNELKDKGDRADAETPPAERASTGLLVQKSIPAGAPASEAEAPEAAASPAGPGEPHEAAALPRQATANKEAPVAARTSGVKPVVQPVEKVRGGLCCKKCWAR